jgi:drug/metabolite transporter (DMT)-like permease
MPVILLQSFLVWQLILSVLILGRKYRANQIFGCLLVTAGVILAVASGANSGPFLSDVKLFWPAVLMASSACHAGASIIKVKCTNLCTSNEPISYLNSYLFYSMAGICFY